MEQILLTYSLPREAITAIMMLYKNTKVKVRSPDGNIDFFDIVAGVMQGDTLTPYLFIICLDYILPTLIDLMKENGFTLKKTRSRRYPAWNIMDTDYADDIMLLANTPAQAESLLHSLEQVAGSIGLHVNADKTEYMCFNQRGNISPLNGRSETCKQIHLPQKQCLIYRKRHQYVTSEGMDHYQWVIGHMEVRPIRWNKSHFFPSSSRLHTTV